VAALRDALSRDAFARRRYRVLFATLLLTLAVEPLSEAIGLPRVLFHLVVALTLVTAAAGVSPHRGRRALLIGLALIAVIVRALPEETMPPWAVMAAGVLWLTVAIVACGAAVRFALRSMTVDAEHVAAALSAYLLAGVLFAVLYVLVDYRWPGSVVELSGGAGPLTLETAVYYSFVTLATLGYGDVVPRGVARGLAVVEAVGAQLYLTVTVARLVGLYAQRRSQAHDGTGGDAT